MAIVRDLLMTKGDQVLTTSPDETVLEAVRRMNEHRVGALVVMERHRIVGIFTERDVLQRVVTQRRPAEELRVDEVMTRQVTCCRLDTPVEEAARMMRDQRVRHLPVCDSGKKLVGLVSIGDVNAYHVRAQQDALEHLQAYVYHSA